MGESPDRGNRQAKTKGMLVICPLQVSAERACSVCMQEDVRGEGAKLDSGVGDDRA